MKTALIALAFAATGTLVLSTASAQQVRHGSVSKIDEPNVDHNHSTDARRHSRYEQWREFRFQGADGLSFNALRAGDKVTFTVDDINGAKTCDSR